MRIYFDPAGTIPALRQCIQQALQNGAGGLVVLTSQANAFAADALEALLRSVDRPLVGGIFPNIIHSGRSYDRGSVVLGFSGWMKTCAIDSLDAGGVELERKLEEFEDGTAGRTMVVFVDGFARRITPFMDSLFDVFGLEINYIGGGAGSLEAERQPCLLTQAGLIGNGAVMALVETASGVGVAHGWRAMSEPMQATDTDGNVLKAIEFRNAFEVYAEGVARKTGHTFLPEDFFKCSRRFPFGIARMNREMIVRDPLKVTSAGFLVCAGEIPRDSYISILSGDESALLEAAERAAAMGTEALPGGQPAAYLLMDCISRRVFLDAQFDLELKRMTPGNLPSAGACTIGEIANSGAEFLEFYNKTAVVAAMGAEP